MGGAVGKDASGGGSDGAAIHDAAVEPWLMCPPDKPRRASTCNVYVPSQVCPYDAAVCTCTDVAGQLTWSCK